MFDVRDVSYTLLYISQSLLSSSIEMPTPAQLRQLDPNQDDTIDTSDAFFLLRALFRLVYFLPSVQVTPVQDPESQCLFTVELQLGTVGDLPPGPGVEVLLDFAFRETSAADGFASSDLVAGELETTEKGVGLNGGFVLAQLTADNTFIVQLNSSFVSEDIGLSVVMVTFDASNVTSASRSVQFFGRPPLRYPFPLHLNLTVRDTDVLVAALSGYSPFLLASNTLLSSMCSDVPLLEPNLDIIFQSPFQANLSWMLQNRRIGESLTSDLSLLVTQCRVTQTRVTMNSTCSGPSTVAVDTPTSHVLDTVPFTTYYLQVQGPTSSTNQVGVVSPEAAPSGVQLPRFVVMGDNLVFSWVLPASPNGVISHYTLYLDAVAVFNGSSLSYSHSLPVSPPLSYSLEAHNSAGTGTSEEGLISSLQGSGLSLAAEEAIVIAVVLTAVLITVLLIIMCCGMWKRRRDYRAKKKPAFLSSNFEAENIGVEKIPLPEDSVYVLLPLDAQKEKRFEEKFSKDQSTTFWYQDEKGIELLPPKFESSSESSEDETDYPENPLGLDGPWSLGELEVPEKMDMSDLWVTEDAVGLNDSKPSKKYSITHQKTPKRRSLHRDRSSGILHRVSFSRQREDDEIPLVPLNEQPEELDTIAEDETAGLVLEQSASGLQRRVPKPPASDETDAQLARRLRAAVRTSQDLTEFRDLISIRPPSAATQAQLPFNSAKNRYRNVLPCDETRVELKDPDPLVEGSDYINANYLDGHGSSKAYIATQGPLPNTIPDFWKMVWEQRSEVIVMTTNFEEKGRKKSEKYWPDKGHSRRYGDVIITCTNQIPHEGCVESRLLVSTVGDSSNKRSIIHYHYIHWPDFGSPPVKSLVELVRRIGATKPDKPMVLHCSAGLGRTGVLACVHSALECHVDRCVVDLHRIVADLRRQREGMVQTQEQYRVCYEAVAEACLPAEMDREVTQQCESRPLSYPPPPYKEKEDSPLHGAAPPTSPSSPPNESSMPKHDDASPPPPPTSPPPPLSEPSTPVKAPIPVTPPSTEQHATDIRKKDVSKSSVPSHSVSDAGHESPMRSKADRMEQREVVVQVEPQSCVESSEEVQPQKVEPEPVKEIPTVIVTSPSTDDFGKLDSDEDVPPPLPSSSPPPPSTPSEDIPPPSSPPEEVSSSSSPSEDISPASTPPGNIPPSAPPEGIPPPLPSSPPPSEPTEVEEEKVEEEEEGGFAIGDDQFLEDKPYEKKDVKKELLKKASKTQRKWGQLTGGQMKSGGQPKWGQSTGGQPKWGQPTEGQPSKAVTTGPSQLPKWKLEQQRRAEEAKQRAMGTAVEKPADQEKTPADVVRQQAVSWNPSSPKDSSSTPRRVGKLRIPAAFSGAPATPDLPHSKVRDSAAQRLVRVELEKSSGSQPTPPSSPAPVKKSWSSTPTPGTLSSQPVSSPRKWSPSPSPPKEAEDTSGNTPPAIRKLRQLQHKTASSTASASIYKLPSMTTPTKSPSLDTAPAKSSAHDPTEPKPDSTHSTETGTGNVARLLAKFQ